MKRPIHLTAAEHDVLRLIATGKHTKEIMVIRNCGMRTVDKHRCALLRKLSAHSAAELVICAFNLGVVTATVRPLVAVAGPHGVRYEVTM